MKFAISLFFLMLLSFSTHAQWSVQEDNPRLVQNKAEWYLLQPFSKAEWNASNFASAKDMKWFNDARYGMFISYGLSSYVNKDLSWPIVHDRKLPDQGHGAYPDSAWQKTWPSQWKMEKFNADEWVKIARAAGMKYMVIIVKHHDGFHMWDTKFSDFKITNTPFKRDYLRELVNACNKAKMPIGIYYSQRDWYHPYYEPIDSNNVTRQSSPPYYKVLPGKEAVPGPNHQKYIDYQFNVVRELLTNYGKIDLFWFDASWWGKMFMANMWDSEKLTRMMRQLQPHIIINNRASIPGDYDTPEQRIGMYQSRSWESCMTMNGSWAFDPRPSRSVKKLIRDILMAGAGNGNVLLSWGAKFNGAFDEAQKDTLIKVGNWLQKYGTAYYGTRGGPWMPARNFGAVYKDKKVYLYVLDWNTEGLLLPALEKNTVTRAVFLNINEKLNWKDEGKNLRISKPANPDDIVTLVELTLQQPITQIVENNVKSIFEDPAFGEKFITKAIDASDWKQNETIIDLGTEKNVTGIRVYDNSRAIIITTSTDNKNWKEAGEAAGRASDVTLTTFMTGVYVPGKQVRFIRLKTNKPASIKLDVYAK